MNVMKNLLASTALVLMSVSVVAAESAVDTLKNNLAEHVPGAKVSRIKETPIAGVYEVIVGSDIYYMDISARYIINGDLIDLATRTNFTEEAKTFNRKAKVAELGEKNMVVYTPKIVDHTITVVTDIDCPYCRRLHSEIDEYMEGKVKVRYIFMPLKGKSDFDTTVSVWCSEDRNLALDIAKAGGELEKATCENPIDLHLKISRELGVRGTPAIILEDGSMLPGYVPAKKLVAELNRLQAAAAK
jgi:thiol:disulfide interchange protein DsbC